MLVPASFGKKLENISVQLVTEEKKLVRSELEAFRYKSLFFWKKVTNP